MAELLQEFVDSHGVSMSVDRERGILRGVKLIGLESRNGRRYREAALADAAALYEEAKVNVNHPKDGPLTPRDYQDRLGVVRGVELRNGEGLFGDLHFNPKHALAEQLVWDAEHNPRNVGFSHNVLARLTREGETTLVEEITKVRSVDLVADPATTQGLFEQEDPSLKKWDALTLEVLELHRPDLLAEIQQQLAESDSQVVSIRRKQRVYELLCEHRLAITSDADESQDVAPQAVSRAFVELLMEVEDDQQLKALIAERAELGRRADGRQQLSMSYSPPKSSEQTRITSRLTETAATAEEFAALLKSSCN